MSLPDEQPVAVTVPADQLAAAIAKRLTGGVQTRVAVSAEGVDVLAPLLAELLAEALVRNARRLGDRLWVDPTIYPKGRLTGAAEILGLDAEAALAVSGPLAELLREIRAAQNMFSASRWSRE